jgi:hypothetical protein
MLTWRLLQLLTQQQQQQQQQQGIVRMVLGCLVTLVVLVWGTCQPQQLVLQQ